MHPYSICKAVGFYADRSVYDKFSAETITAAITVAITVAITARRPPVGVVRRNRIQHAVYHGEIAVHVADINIIGITGVSARITIAETATGRTVPSAASVYAIQKITVTTHILFSSSV